MTNMTTRPTTGSRLQSDAKLSEVIDAVNELLDDVAERSRVSPSTPLDEPHPSASIVYSDQEYDALAERLEAPPAPNERLRRTVSGRPTAGR